MRKPASAFVRCTEALYYKELKREGKKEEESEVS